MALHEHRAHHLDEDDTAVTKALLRLRSWAIRCLNELGDSFAQAIEYGQDLLADCERALGETHPSTLASRDNFANAHQDAGRVDEAAALQNRAGPG
jgi:Tetratricopeptide repeat